MMETMATRALAPWFGANRMLSRNVSEELTGCHWVGVPFAGGMSELADITASTIVVNDLHRHVINLANVLKDPYMGPRLIRQLKREAFHPMTLAEAQEWCKRRTERPAVDNRDIEAARYYFITSWMGRSHKAGTIDEFNGGLSIRWNSNGGDSNLRYRSAVKSLNAWRRIFVRCGFSCMDAFGFLDRCDDTENTGIYCDPPFPGPGAKYRHAFSDEDHIRLAQRLAEFDSARVVCRFYDVPLIREIYPERLGWIWRRLTGRKQTNEEAPEALILNGPSREKSNTLF